MNTVTKTLRNGFFLYVSAFFNLLCNCENLFRYKYSNWFTWKISYYILGHTRTLEHFANIRFVAKKLATLFDLKAMVSTASTTNNNFMIFAS